MHADARKQAQKRADRILSARAELAELEREGGLTLTDEQRAAVEAHWSRLLSRFRQELGVDATDSAKRVSWGMRVAFLLGAAALLAAAILFLHRVWGYLSTPVQIIILTAAPLALLAAAEFTRKRSSDPYYTGLLATAAGVAFVIEINSLGTVLNLLDSPHVLLAWGLFALLVSYAYNVRILLGAGVILLNAWSAAVVLHLQGYYWADFFQTPHWLLPGALIAYAIPSLWRARGPRETDSMYRLCGAGFGLFALLQLSIVGDLCCGPLDTGLLAAAYQLFGLLLSAAVIFHGFRLGRAGLVNLGAASFIVFLFVRLHSWWWNWMPKYLFFLLIGAIALGLLLVFRRMRTRLSGGEIP